MLNWGVRRERDLLMYADCGIKCHEACGIRIRWYCCFWGIGNEKMKGRSCLGIGSKL